MPIDLSNPIKVNVVSVSEKPNGGAKIDIEVPDMSRFPFPLHLTPDQAGQLKGTGEYTVLLVQSKLKDGKDGSWQSDYWYNAAMFDGVPDERNMPKVSNPSPVEERSRPPQPKAVPPVQTPSISREDLIVKQVIFKEASTHAVGDTVAEVVMNLDLLFKEFTKVFYGDYKSSPLVEEASKQGAKVVDIKTKEEPLFEPEESSLDNTQWDYKKPEGLVSYAEFVLYVKNCGWILEDVVKWLGMEVEAYVSQPGKGYMTAAKVCKDKALEQGLEPPFDFRQEKKETK